MTTLTPEEQRIVEWLRTEPSRGLATLRVRAKLAWLHFWYPHVMIERTAKLLAHAIERGEHRKQEKE